MHRDHPRRCGENSNWVDKTGETLGSPPQVRGKLMLENIKDLRSGITPAGAGKTFAVLHSRAAATDHPRRCGENRGQL